MASYTLNKTNIINRLKIIKLEINKNKLPRFGPQEASGDRFLGVLRLVL